MKRNLLWIVLIVLFVVPFAMGASCSTSGGGDDDDDDGLPTDDDSGDDDSGDDDSGDDDSGDDDSGDDDSGDDDDDDDGMSVADAREEAVGSTVTVSAVITSPTNWKDDLFFIQDEAKAGSSGVAVYMWSEVASGFDGEPGDTVTVTGELTDYFDLLEIKCTEVGSVEVTGSGTIPDPANLDVDEVGEDYEGMLIEVQDVTVTDTPDEHGGFVVEDGNGDSLVVDDLFFEKDHWVGYGVDVDDEFASIIGVLTYDYDEFKLEPRSDSDLSD